MLHSKLLCLNVRPENVPDFAEITHFIQQRAPEIGVLGRPGDFQEFMVPPPLRHLPRLSVYLVNPPVHPAQKGSTVSVMRIDKLDQCVGFQKHQLPTPKTAAIRLGDSINESEWGKHVIVKPRNESYGRGVLLLPTALVNNAKAIAEIQKHLQGTGANYLIQEFIRPDAFILRYRAIVFMGKVVMLYKSSRKERLVMPSTLQDSLNLKVFDSTQGYHRKLIRDEEVEEFAVRMFQSHAQQPLQGLDICRNADNGKLYAIENNAGGNVWAFSIKSALLNRAFSRDKMVEQFNAFSTAADALIEHTKQLAC